MQLIENCVCGYFYSKKFVGFNEFKSTFDNPEHSLPFKIVKGQDVLISCPKCGTVKIKD